MNNKTLIYIFLFTLILGCNLNEVESNDDDSTLELLYPRGGEQLVLSEEPLQVKWASNNLTEINIYFKNLLDSSWILIADAIDSKNGVYNWQPPNSLSQNYLLKITDSQDKNLSDETIAPFLITASTEVLEAINYYPLKIGNIWFYEVKYIPNWDPINNDTTTYFLRSEVVADSTFENGELFFTIRENTSYHYEKIDYRSGKVLKKEHGIDSEEIVIYNLITKKGEKFMSQRFYSSYYVITEFIADISKEYFGYYHNAKQYREISEFAFCDYFLVKGIGLGSYNQGLAPSVQIGNLRGCIIDGILYGDTTSTN